MGRKTGQRRQLLQHGGLATDFAEAGAESEDQAIFVDYMGEAAPRDEPSRA